MTDRPAPAVSTCDSCSDRFFLQADAWGPLCGTCIAARLELALLRAALGADLGRRPMRRSPALADRTGDRRRA